MRSIYVKESELLRLMKYRKEVYEKSKENNKVKRSIKVKNEDEKGIK
jgi:hypothetical protein